MFLIIILRSLGMYLSNRESRFQHIDFGRSFYRSNSHVVDIIPVDVFKDVQFCMLKFYYLSSQFLRKGYKSLDDYPSQLFLKDGKYFWGKSKDNLRTWITKHCYCRYPHKQYYISAKDYARIVKRKTTIKKQRDFVHSFKTGYEFYDPYKDFKPSNADIDWDEFILQEQDKFLSNFIINYL